MSRSTISTFKLFEMFPDEGTARQYLESRLWPNGTTCPECKSNGRITARKQGYYRCNACKLDFTVRTGTIFERSHVPLHKWLYAMYLLVTARKGISSLQLGKEIGITQKSAWFVLHRLREACAVPPGPLGGGGIVEVDEAYFGGSESKMHKSVLNRLKQNPFYGRNTNKTCVLGMRERGGRVVALVPRADQTSFKAVCANLAPGSTVHTDEATAYAMLGERGYKHETVNHQNKEYVRGNVTTNGIESVWAVLNRGLHGVYHHASKKHMPRYVNEFTFRLNEGNVERHTTKRLDSFVNAVTGKRITYKELTA